MKKTLSLLLFVVLAWPPLVFGQLSSNVDQRTKLVGVSEIKVLVHDFDKGERLDGFSSKAYKTAVELRLRQLGVPLIDSFSAQFSQRGTLLVEVSPLKVLDSGYAVTVKVVLNRPVGVFDGEKWNINIADVWDEGEMYLVGMDSVSRIKEKVVELADIFANDYLMVNSPEPRSGAEGD